MKTRQDSADYQQKKAQLRQLLTVYGRKPVNEALNNSELNCAKLHLAESNKPSAAIQAMLALAQQRDIDVAYHSRQALSRISKNGKQDQGICLDIHCPAHQSSEEFLKSSQTNQASIRLLALDRITNPQNLGMIIRSAAAGNINGILMAEKGCAKLDALVIKASAGTLFKAPIIKTDKLPHTLDNYQQAGAKIVGLSSHANHTLAEFSEPDFVIYVLGNESEGVDSNIQQRCDSLVSIPMNNQVESLNVAVTASLLAFRGLV